MKVVFPQISGIKYVQDGPWVAIKDAISYEQVASVYGDEFIEKYGDKALKELEENPIQFESSNAFLATPDGALYNSNDLYSGTSMSQNIERIRFYIKVPRKIYIKKSPNPYEPGKEFTHFISPDKEIIDITEYKFKNGYYINKKNPKLMYAADQVDTYNSNKKEKMIEKYDADIYEATIIAGTFILSAGKKKHIYRDSDNRANIKLPIIGRSFSGLNETPNSLIWDTKDIAELYMITIYHMELMMALAGTKTMIIDRSQRPSTMTDEEWEYQMKTGRLYIETLDANGRAKNMSFNQWQSFDNSLSATIQYFQPVLEMFYQIMGTLIGIPRQAVGQVINSDQVGTYEMSAQQSSLITEILYDEHDETLRQALEQLINISLKYNFKEGITFELEHGGKRERVIIPKDEMDKIKFNIVLKSNSKEEKEIEDLKQIALNQYSKAMLPLRQLAGIYSIDSVKEFEKKLEYFEDEAKKINSQSQAQNLQSALEMEKQKLKFAHDLQMEMENLRAQVDGMKLKLEEAKLNVEIANNTKNLAFAEKELGVNANLKMMDLAYEDKIESAMLKENISARTTQNQIDLLSMNIQSLLSKREQDKKEKIEMRKAPKQKIEDLNDN